VPVLVTELKRITAEQTLTEALHSPDGDVRSGCPDPGHACGSG